LQVFAVFAYISDVMITLGIESSCDETSAAIVRDGKVLSNIISSQVVHERYGGIVPELASRAHQQMVVPIVEQALHTAGVTLADIEGIAVTHGPGLVGSLLVGLNFAKGLALGLGIPFVGINHLEAHLYSGFIDDPGPEYPFLCLLVSGGHTQLILVSERFRHEVLGETLDDAAGEAYDKVAKMLGLGFPGGPVIDRLARQGRPDFAVFPRSMLDSSSLDFSFSGIKTSVLYWLKDNGYRKGGGEEPVPPANVIADLCASFQEAVVDVLVGKTSRALALHTVRDVTVAGGVSANSALRLRLKSLCDEQGIRLHLPRPEYCTDNGGMVAMLGWMKLTSGYRSALDLNAIAGLSL
jgi:N6-L-threonylcarbamoyladenine synthase